MTLNHWFLFLCNKVYFSFIILQFMSNKNANPLDGGDLVVKSLLKEGITKIFGIVGGELLRIYDAIERVEKKA